MFRRDNGGRLRIDHAKQVLGIEVRPPDGEWSEVQSLSGERETPRADITVAGAVGGDRLSVLRN
jgi:hypothetical protein